MRLFSAIVRWFRQTVQAGRFYELYRKSPEQLQAAHAELHAVLQKMEEGEATIFYRAVGGALTTWALMEERLVMIAAILLKTMSRKTGLIFYSIINFQVWLSIITELFKLEPDMSSFQRRWNKIAERLRAEKDNRDRLAHTPMLSSSVSDNLERKPIMKAPRLDMRAKSQAFAPLGVEQIMEFRGRIGAISDDLLKLMDDMMDHLKNVAPPTSQEKPSPPITDQAD